MIRALRCFFRLCPRPRGWNRTFSWGFECQLCKRYVKGDMR